MYMLVIFFTNFVSEKVLKILNALRATKRLRLLNGAAHLLNADATKKAGAVE